tara:strand:+ start:135758 stop:136630 length:873 start_codon:yes stop_codon:yes gene_type:complete
MQNKLIQFKKQRDLGAILGDTFSFLRNEWKQLFTLIFKIAGPALILVVASYIFYMSTTLGSFADLTNPSGPIGNFTFNAVLAILLMLCSIIAFYALLYGTILNYIKSYIKNNGIVDVNEVRVGVRSKFWSLIGLSFLVALITGVGIVFCVIPGIYLGTVLITTYAIHVFEDRDVMDTISYSFQLIKGEWWITFATLLVMFILYYIILMIFNIPQYIYMFIKMFTIAEQASPDPTSMFDTVYIILNAIAVVAQYLLHTVIVICAVFVYFNLNEKKNFTGTMETIDAIGTQE